MFNNAQRNFLRIFDAMAFPTLADARKQHEEQLVAFYHCREDQAVMERALVEVEEFKRKSLSVPTADPELRVLTIASGSEHVFHCLRKPNVHVTAVDLNPEQIRVCQDKLKLIDGASGNCPQLESEAVSELADLGRFEWLF